MRLSRYPFRVALLATTVLAPAAALANITVNGTSHSSGVRLNTANATWTISGTASGYVQVQQNCTIILDNVTWTDPTTKTNAIQITDGLTVTLKLKGMNKITCSASDGRQTGIMVTSNTTLNITNLTDDASLTVTATAAYRDCAIGGSYNDNSSSSACGTINIYGGNITARSGVYCAGIGGFGTGSSTAAKKGAGGVIRVYGGSVAAYGGGTTGGGAGIGGGNGGAGGSFYNYGGTVWATAGRADSSYESDIGKGASGSSGSFVIMGGSTIATNGKIDATAKNSDGTRVYRVAVTTPSANTDYTFSGLGSYGQTTLRSNSSKLLHLWLPNGTHKFEDDDYGYSATVASAKTTAVRNAKVTVTFSDSDGTAIAAVKGLPGAPLPAPPNPAKKGFAFTGWSQSIPATFPEESMVLTAQWEKVRKGVVIAFF